MKNATFPVILVVLGVAWLVQGRGWLPDWHSVGAIGLVVAGAVVLFAEGITKTSIVTGPMLIYAGAAWYGHDQRLAGWDVIAPLGLIVLGVCLFASRLPAVPHDRRHGGGRRGDAP